MLGWTCLDAKVDRPVLKIIGLELQQPSSWITYLIVALILYLISVYQKADDKIFICKLSKSVNSNLYHIENSKTRGQTV